MTTNSQIPRARYLAGSSRLPDVSPVDDIADILDALPLPVPRITDWPGVYRPDVDSALLCAAVSRELLGHREMPSAAEICAGSGIASIYAARLGASVTALDRGRRQVAAIRINAARNRTRVRARRADVRAPLPLEPVGLLFANPPYVPTPVDAADTPAARAWNAGGRGRDILDAIIEQIPTVVRPGGVVLLVHSALNGVDETLQRLAQVGCKARVTRRHSVAFGPVMRERSEWLRDNTFISAGQAVEELVVVRGLQMR
ncbi:methyltransferase [Williamsia sterculiae]|uniref:Release factor glutamine methyltransferase n=1 Tax=Williamsia sterculiae TaxID=1344003 RepID=A0A1N7F5F3_9NOCA|nr:methyltransferase [Williamsia sterculiae]SIR95597.1 release factor glutamine methyltransferase [Williamsia sterculiae]